MRIIGKGNVTCPVELCRGNCKPLPEGAEVIRADGMVVCDTCGQVYHKHERFYYPSGMGHCVRACDGMYLHL